jgi:hypothetical protein
VFAAGLNSLCTLTLTNVNTNAGSVTTLLNFTNTPTTNLVANAAGTNLNCAFVYGIGSLAGTQAVFAAGGATNNGFFSQVIHVVNPTGSQWQGVKVLISGLGVDSRGSQITVMNATGTENGVPYILYQWPLAPGASVDLTIEYFVSDRVTTPTPQLTVQQGFPETLTPPVLTGVASIVQALFKNGGSYLYFQSKTRTIYYIQYSDDLVTWNTVLPGLTGTGYTLQWLDNGPPKTRVSPAAAPTRFYRIVTQ